MPQSTPSPRRSPPRRSPPRRSPPRRSPPRRRRTLRPRSTSIARQLRMNTPPSTPDNRRGLFGTPNNVSPPRANQEPLTPRQIPIRLSPDRDEKNDKINRADDQSHSPLPPNEEQIQRGTPSPRSTPSPSRTPSPMRPPSPSRTPSPMRGGGKSHKNKSRRNKSRRNKSRRNKSHRRK